MMTLFACAAPLLVARTARADDLERRFGAGVGLHIGGGVNLTSYAEHEVLADAWGPTFLGAGGEGSSTLELQAFTVHDFSVDFSIPLTDTVIAASLGDAWWQTDAYFNFNAGRGNVRCVVGPGLGFTAATAPSGVGTIGAVRFPAEIGLEALTKNLAFGFKLLVRPWAELNFGHDASSLAGGGAVLMLGFSGYDRAARH